MVCVSTAVNTERLKVSDQLHAVAPIVALRLLLDPRRAAETASLHDLGGGLEVIAVFVLCQFNSTETLHTRLEKLGHSGERQEDMRTLDEVRALITLSDSELGLVVQDAVRQDLVQHLRGHAADVVLAIFDGRVECVDVFLVVW